jgi:hypothetical protein
MLVLNHSLLSKEYTVTNVLKVLASINSMCSLQLKITPRYFISLMKRIFDPFNVKMSLNQSNSVRETNGLNLILINFMFQRSHHILIAWRPRCSLSHIYRCHPHRPIYIYIHIPGAWGYHLYIHCATWGTGKNLVAILLVFLLAYKFHLCLRLQIFSEKEKS